MRRITTQRVGVLVELPGLLRDLEVDVDAVFEGSGVDPGSFSPDLRLPFPDLLDVLERAARISGRPYIGLLLGLRFDVVRHHGLIGELMLTAPTLKQALVDCVTWQLGYSSGAIVYLNRLGDEYDFGYGTYDVSSPGTRVLYDVIVCIAIRMVQELTNGTVAPIEAHFSHGADDDRAIYGKLLRLPARFNQSRTGVILKATAMATTPPRADPVERQRLLSIIKDAVWTKEPGLADEVSHAIRQQLHYEKPTMTAVARELGVHPRTLRRRLAEERETFERLRDSVRYAVARELLELTGIPVAEVGASLGFENPGVFSRSFRRWSGTSPSSWRRDKQT
jgi:AraC-like DNA-binding protein